MYGSSKRRWAGLSVLAVLLCWIDRGPCPGVDAVAPTRSGAATVYASQITIDTYNYGGYLKTEYNSTYNMQYAVLDWWAYVAHRAKAPRTYDTIVMENDYLEVTVIPALGGRIYSLVFKPTGNNEFYSNRVLKPTHWGPPEQGWWLAAGGMEWCLPVDEHGYEWAIPWAATTSADGDGVYVTLTDTTRTDRLRARITLHLPHDKAYLMVTPRIENPTARGIWFKYWTNVQVAPGPSNTLSADFRFVLPTDQVTIHSTGDSRAPGPGEAMSWPWYGGLDWSRLGTWNEWMGFFARPAAAADFQGVYDTSVDEGLARVFPSDVARGAKGFAWGWNNAYPASAWTGDKTYYAEMHGGIAPTFAHSTYLPAGGATEWREAWYPVAGIGGLTTANDRAALSLQVQDAQDAQVTIGVQPTAIEPEGWMALWRPGDPEPLYTGMVSLSPGVPYRTTLSPGGDLGEWVLVYLDRDGNLLATTDPAPETSPPVAWVGDLPPYVTSPTDLVVSWSGGDRHSCVIEYDVQVKDGYDGTWTDWLTRTTAISATYDGGAHGHTTFFRARARDLYGNLGAFGGDDAWGQAFCSLLLTPEPVLVTSRKWADRLGVVDGDVLTYTVSVRNTGNADATTVWVTDTLPGELALLTGTVRVDGGPPLTAAPVTGDVAWQGTVTAGQRVELSFAAQVLPDVVVDLSPLSNTMTVTHQGASFVRQTSVILGHLMLFPVTARNGSP